MVAVSANLLYGFDPFNLQNTSPREDIRHHDSANDLGGLDEEGRRDGEAQRL
jgi:hypothetical protein